MPLKSLRVRLLALLGALILLASAAQFATLFQVSLSSANTLFDYHMQQMALALQDSNFEQKPLDGVDTGQGFDFVIQVWGDAGNQVYQSRPHRALPRPGANGYANVTLFNGEWRIYTVHTQHKVIQVAQQMQARRKRTIQIALQSLWPVWLGALLLLAASWWVVTSALQPVERVRQELGQRDGNSLEPLDAHGLPQEITPLVNDMNALLLRVSDTLNAQQRFIADAAHELRSPLTALKLQVQLLARARDQQERQLAESRLAAATERVIHLAEQLLQLAREDAQEAAAGSQTSLDLHACLRQAIDDAAVFSGSKHIEIGLELSDEAMIHAPHNAIHVLLRNLLDNAIRYTPAGGRIQIVTQPLARGVRLRIADSGPGIDANECERVFDRFYRISGNQQSGSGLGLAIVKTITDRLGARIQLSRADIGGLQVDIVFI